jgi:hypothetical protein
MQVSKLPRVCGHFVLLPLTLALGITAANAQEERSFEIYGFGMADYIQDTKRVDPAWEDAFRPSKIAAPEGQFGTNGQADVSAKQSRLGFKGVLPTGDATPPLNFKFEFDMFGVGADAGKTSVRLRHAYGEWGEILGGQTHTLFMDIDVFPNVIDYWGPPGMVFLRHAQIRWTPYRTGSDQFAMSLEQPSSDVDPGNIRLIEEFANANVRNDEKLPDFAAQYRMDRDWGHAQIAGILRRVGYEYQVNSQAPFQKGSRTGWGIALTSALKAGSLFPQLEKDKLLLSILYGHGIATYMNDGGMDIAPTATFSTNINPAPGTPTLASEAVPLLGFMAYYDHYWTPKLSSSIGYSFTKVTNTNFQAADAFHRGDYASVNLLAYPADKLMFGAEIMWGQRMNNDGVSGHDWRFQFSAKYDFGIKF